MSDDSPGEVDHQARYDRPNMTHHTSVLGVDITAYPQEEYALMNGFRTKGGLTAEPELWTWTGEAIDHGCRAEIAAWARRTIFAIEGSHAE